MKDKRKELIDFMQWQIRDSLIDNVFTDIDFTVDTYLKSINSVNEPVPRALGKNEHQKKNCDTCKHLNNFDISWITCDNCNRYERWESNSF